METSFTSLQSPCEPYPITCSSSKASSVAGSLFSRSQLNSILHYDANSVYDDSLLGRSMSAGPSEATTVLLGDPLPQYPYRGKSVAFDISRNSRPSTNSPSPNILPKSILHRQTFGPPKKPTTLSFNGPSPDASGLNRKIDFVHDDWYGMAPLASPETLSEISSISSRTSLTMNLASSIEKYLHRVTSFNNSKVNQSDVLSDDDVSESQLVTPKVMRRTPKITGNLSTCADDWRSVDSYKRMGKIFVTNPNVPSNSDSSEEQSFESSFSLTKSKCCAVTENSKSADNLDGDNQIIQSVNVAKFTMSDSAILNECISTCPRCPCKITSSVLRMDCCQKYEHSSCIDTIKEQIPQTNTSSTSDTTYHSAMSSLNTFDPIQFSPTYTTSLNENSSSSKSYDSPARCRSGVLESHFPVYLDNTVESTSLLPVKIKSPKIVLKSDRRRGDVSFVTTKRINDDNDDRCFSRNESLPLLANLNEKSSPIKYVHRKNHVYPMQSSPRPSTSKKGESSV